MLKQLVLICILQRKNNSCGQIDTSTFSASLTFSFIYFLHANFFHILCVTYFEFHIFFFMQILDYNVNQRSNFLLVTSYQSLVDSCQSLVTCYGSLTTSHQLLVTSDFLLVASDWSLLPLLLATSNNLLCEIHQIS